MYKCSFPEGMMDSGSNRKKKNAPRRLDETVASEESKSSVFFDDIDISLINIRATGDVLLDVCFDNSQSTARLPATRGLSTKPTGLLRNVKSTNSRTVFRVRFDTLKKTSKYFGLLLGSETFEEGKRISESFKVLQSRGVAPSEADPADLPRISIIDDDDGTRIAGRETVFGDLLHILHGSDISSKCTISYLATLAIMADRFDCTGLVGRYFRNNKKMAWPQTYGNVTPVVEDVIRQKILISWLLDDQPKFSASTKELILRGSSRWVSEEPPSRDQRATWWDLQDGLEAELLYRRTCILLAVSSLQKHFIHLYSSKTRQCKQFYDSSAACDSYQLGEMIKFFLNKGLLSLASTLSIGEDEYPAIYSGDIETLITILRQCPAYQIDSNHAHCGMRTRIVPALDFIQSMLTSNVGIDWRGWKQDRPATSWENVNDKKSFIFTKGIAGDQRLKMDGFIIGSKHARDLFTASEWLWSPEEGEEKDQRLGRAFGSITGF